MLRTAPVDSPFLKALSGQTELPASDLADASGRTLSPRISGGEK